MDTNQQEMWQMIAKRFGLTEGAMSKFLTWVHGEEWKEKRPSDLIAEAKQHCGFVDTLPAADALRELYNLYLEKTGGQTKE